MPIGANLPWRPPGNRRAPAAAKAPPFRPLGNLAPLSCAPARPGRVASSEISLGSNKDIFISDLPRPSSQKPSSVRSNYSQSNRFRSNPDTVADQISDAVVDLSSDATRARVAARRCPTNGSCLRGRYAARWTFPSRWTNREARRDGQAHRLRQHGSIGNIPISLPLHGHPRISRCELTRAATRTRRGRSGHVRLRLRRDTALMRRRYYSAPVLESWARPAPWDRRFLEPTRIARSPSYMRRQPFAPPRGRLTRAPAPTIPPSLLCHRPFLGHTPGRWMPDAEESFVTRPAVRDAAPTATPAPGPDHRRHLWAPRPCRGRLWQGPDKVDRSAAYVASYLARISSGQVASAARSLSYSIGFAGRCALRRSPRNESDGVTRANPRSILRSWCDLTRSIRTHLCLNRDLLPTRYGPFGRRAGATVYREKATWSTSEAAL